MAIVGSQLPDIDTTTSTIGQIFYPVAAWIEKRYPHRTFVESADRAVADQYVTGTVGVKVISGGL